MMRKVKDVPRRRSRHGKPSGILGTSWHYAKDLFVLLFMNGPAKDDGVGSRSSATKPNQPLSEAVKLYEEAASEGHAESIMTLATFNFFSPHNHPRNFTRAFEWYQEMARLNGNSTAHNMLGFMYATGIGGVVPKDQAKALLYNTFAADAGNSASAMTVGYRHLTGIGVPQNCNQAVHYYKTVADQTIGWLRGGPPGGRQVYKEAYRLADEEGGVYGEGASVSSSGYQAAKNAQSGEVHDDLLEYLDLMSRKGELKATFSLGRLHYEGSRELKQDFHAAKDYFTDVAKQYWSREGKIKSDTEQGVDKLASKAAGYLGRMFLRGEGMEQNFAKARTWFRRGIENGDALCQYSLGLMHQKGLGVLQDSVKAAEYWAAAADQDLSAAQAKLGAMLLDQGDVPNAVRYFELAARHAHIEAVYYLAEITNQGIGRERNCNAAASYYKAVAEQHDPIFHSANEAYEDGDLPMAMLWYMMAAEQGWEIGQSNVAWLLDETRKSSPLNNLIFLIKRKASFFSDATLALVYWTRSAKQQNIDSMVKMGDYYLSGIGTNGSLPDNEKAAACYQAAAETMQSAQAMWNLGWMHENGIGIEQDFHLAKRFYDQALETNKEAYLPVNMALLKLRLRSAWNTITRGKVNPIRDEPTHHKRYSLMEWVANFLEADLEQYEQQLAREDDADEWDTTATGHIPGEDLYDDIDDGIIETFIIVGIAAALAFLVYLRQQRQLQQRRQREEHQAGGQPPPPPQDQQQGPGQRNRGMFPDPGDPDYMNWAVGGVGH